MTFLTKLLEFRGMVRRIFQKYRMIIMPVIKFLFAYLAVHTMNTELAYNAKLSHPMIELGVGVVGAVFPWAVLILLFVVITIAQVFSASPILAALLLVIFAVLYCFAARFSGKYGYAVIAVPVLFVFEMPYFIPLWLGTLATPIAIFPTACGVIVYYVFKVIEQAAQSQNITSLDETLALYVDVVNRLFTHKEMFITVAVFAFVMLVMYLIRKIRFEFVFELAIVLGAILNILCFILVDFQLGIPVDIGSVVRGTLISMVIVLVAQFFRMVLDYLAVEHVQFEDDDYYYYVKAVPKVDVAAPHKNVTTISEAENTEEDFEFEKAAPEEMTQTNAAEENAEDEMSGE